MDFPPFSWWYAAEREAHEKDARAEAGLKVAQHEQFNRLHALDLRADEFSRFGNIDGGGGVGGSDRDSHARDGGNGA